MNPGNLRSKLDRTTPAWLRMLLDTFLYYPPYYGALTELFAGLAPQALSGAYVIPWGRLGRVRSDIADADGDRLWQWCWDECRLFM